MRQCMYSSKEILAYVHAVAITRNIMHVKCNSRRNRDLSTTHQHITSHTHLLYIVLVLLPEQTNKVLNCVKMIGFFDSSSQSALWTIGLLVAVILGSANAFISPQRTRHQIGNVATIFLESTITTSPTSKDYNGLMAQISDEEGDEEKTDNPYQDPNYPDLEFINYSDPDYQVDQGVGDEFFDDTSTEAQVEAMREERRVKNDEFQFETYYKEILKEGEEFKGEWTVFKTSTFVDGENDVNVNEPPKLAKVAGPFKVISRGERINNGPSPSSSESESGKNRLEYERILHHEKVFIDSDSSEDERTTDWVKQEELSMNTKFWPDELSDIDFRGPQGVMIVGNAYTICTATPLKSSPQKLNDEGPFASYQAELGIISDALRFRIKLDYSVIIGKENENPDSPSLHLKTLTICRETLGMWPRADKYKSAIEAVTQDAFFGKRGADGGLYDPPPVGSDEQASQYLLLDLEGRATVLLPHCMDQDPDVYPGSGWVTSLDWTPGKIRYQLDRKVKSGKDILGLRTLELSEVQGAEADIYRPNDGGENMRQ
ncbi:MAG: hypothetical protein ACI8RD_012749 [Bacillariaceae sp.]|jgi:hypothetical protein